MNLDGIDDYAIFGPFSDMCMVSSSACTDGFSITLWLQILSGCDGYILSTRDSTAHDGIQIRCTTSGGFADLDLEVKVGFTSGSLTGSVSMDTWFHVTLSGDLPGSLTLEFDHYSGVSTFSDSSPNPSLSQSLVFGRQWVTVSGGDQGKAKVDEVKIYNRKLI